MKETRSAKMRGRAKSETAGAIGKAIGGVAGSIMEGVALGTGADERDAIESLCRALGVEPDGRDDWVADFARCLEAIARGIEAEREGDFVYTGEEPLAELERGWRCFADEGTPFEDWLGGDPDGMRPAAL